MKEKVIIIHIFCTTCGEKLNFQASDDNTILGIGGTVGGAMLGSKIGIAMGAIGAISGTIPLAILGGVIGTNIKSSLDNPNCSKCGNKIILTNDIIKNARKTEVCVDNENNFDLKKYLQSIDDFFYLSEKDLLKKIYNEYLSYKPIIDSEETCEIPNKNKFINSLFYNSLNQIDVINNFVEWGINGSLESYTNRKKKILIEKLKHNNYYKLLYNICVNETFYCFLANQSNKAKRIREEKNSKFALLDIDIRERRVSCEESLANHLQKPLTGIRFHKIESQRNFKLFG